MRQHFTNFEIFTSVLSGYDLDIRQIDCGLFSASLQQIQHGGVFINRLTTSRRLEVSGNPPPGLRTFGIPTVNCQPFTWRNQNSSGNTIQIYKENTELALITHPLFEAIDISITEEAFNSLSQQWGFPELDKLIGTKEMAVCEPVRMQQLRNLLKHICVAVEDKTNAHEYNTDLQNIIENEVPYLLAETLMTAETLVVKSTPEKRTLALKTAVEYIHSTPLDAISLSTFCRDNAINIRTLQRAFLEQYGISPKYYVQTLRLNNIHKALIHSDPACTRIYDIADSHGYWHMSQFAKDYHRHFGELPSDTLKV